jgi:hypothetical protein
MNRHTTPPLAKIAVLLGLIAGLGLTVYGLVELAMTQPDSSIWRWTTEYLLAFLSATVFLSILGGRRGAVFTGSLCLLALTVMMGGINALAATAFLGLSAFSAGRLILRSSAVTHSDALLAGLVVLGSVLSLLVHLPINSPGMWSVLLLTPMILGRQNLRELLSDGVAKLAKNRSSAEQNLPTHACSPGGLLSSSTKKLAGWHAHIVMSAVFAACMLHVMVALMPEVGHDALATHLMVPAHIARHHSWHFDAGTYAWAVMPMLVDWLYAVGYLFGAETGARLVNTGSLFLLANVVYRVSLWAGAGKTATGWGVLIFLLTPLTFLEGSSLFIEGSWTAFVLGGTLSLCRLVTNCDSKVTDLRLSAVLLGGAMAAKAVSFTVLPVLGLVALTLAPRWFTKSLTQTVARSIGLCLTLGCIPYLNAYLITGNPVFPFFNAVFRSPLFPVENFKPPEIFERGLHWDTLYRITFDSNRYLEATAGASGFQWLLLVVPGILIVTLLWARRSMLLIILGTAWLALVFGQTAYLRYAFPAFGLACAVVAVGIHHAKQYGHLAGSGIVVLAALTATLNLLHFNSGTNYGRIVPMVIMNPEERDTYIAKVVPMRSIISIVNTLNQKGSPVAFFSTPLIAGLHAKALLANWYNPRFQSASLAVSDSKSLIKLLAHEGVDYFVVDDNFLNGQLAAIVKDVSEEIARVGQISVRKIKAQFRYPDELLPSTDLTSGWHLEPGATRVTQGGVRVSVQSPAYTVVSIRPGARYRYTTQARCDESKAEGRLQVNWLNASSQLVRADIEVFTCTEVNTARSMDLTAPPDAKQAVVYASAHSLAPIIFTHMSFAH